MLSAAANASADESRPSRPAGALTRALTEAILASRGLYDPPAPKDALVWPEVAVIAHPAPESPASLPTSVEWVALLAQVEAVQRQAGELRQELAWLYETSLAAYPTARPVLRGGGGSDTTFLPNHLGAWRRTSTYRHSLASRGGDDRTQRKQAQNLFPLIF